MITLHHLRVGRSVFTAWLLEEMGLEYALKIYIRDEQRRAPPELRDIHPLGKSPVIEDNGMVIAESAAIATYLVSQYGADGPLVPPEDLAARVQWTEWLHYPEGSAFAPLLIKLLLSSAQEAAPALLTAFSDGEVKLHLDHIAQQLGNKPFLLGDQLQLPDIGVTYVVGMADRLGLLGDHPTLAAYLQRNTQRPAFLTAWEKTGG